MPVSGHRLWPPQPRLAALAGAEVGSGGRIDHPQLGAGHRPVAPYKRSRAVRFVEAIPRTPSGKILRRVLVEQDRQMV